MNKVSKPGVPLANLRTVNRVSTAPLAGSRFHMKHFLMLMLNM